MYWKPTLKCLIIFFCPSQVNVKVFSENLSNTSFASYGVPNTKRDNNAGGNPHANIQKIKAIWNKKYCINALNIFLATKALTLIGPTMYFILMKVWRNLKVICIRIVTSQRFFIIKEQFWLCNRSLTVHLYSDVFWLNIFNPNNSTFKERKLLYIL